MDDQPDGASPDAGGSPRRPPGPERTYLDQRQRDELLEKVGNAQGVDQALRAMGVPYRAYRNTVEADPDFRAELASARRAGDQMLDEFGTLKAMEGDGNADLIARIWDRRDRGRDLNQARDDRRRERAEDRRDRLRREKAERRERDKDRALRLHMARMAAEARAAEMAAKAGDSKKGDAPVDPRNLTDAELAEFNRLMAKIAAAPPP